MRGLRELIRSMSWGMEAEEGDSVADWANNPWGGASVEEAIKREAEEYIYEADEIVNNYRVNESLDYTWVMRYIKDDYADKFDTLNRINDKARNLQWNIGGLVALVIGLLVYIYRGNIPLHVLILFTPFILFSFGTIWFSMKALFLVTMASPPKASDAIDFAENYGEHSEIYFAFQYIVAAAHNNKVCCALGVLLRCAYNHFNWALITLVMAWVVKIILVVINSMS